MVKKANVWLVGFLMVFLLSGIDRGYCYTTPVADSAVASREFSSSYSSAKAIDDDTGTSWIGPSGSTTDWIKFAIADDNYTTPVSADASRTYNDDISAWGAGKAIDDNTGTYWTGPSGSITDWTRFVIANDTYTTPSTVYASSEHRTSPVNNAKDNDLGTKWLGSTSGATDDFAIFGMTGDVFTSPSSATASTQKATNPPSNAIDEGNSTHWVASTSGSTTDWIKFDMGSIQNISAVRIYENATSGTTDQTATIKVSTNDVDWTTKETGVTIKHGKANYFWWGTSGIRYIKVEIADPGGGSYYPTVTEFDALVTTGATVSTDGCRSRGGSVGESGIARGGLCLHGGFGEFLRISDDLHGRQRHQRGRRSCPSKVGG